MAPFILNPSRFETAGISVVDLKAYWKMDETSGSLINSATTSKSVVGLGSAADLTVAGGPDYNQTGSPSGLGNNMKMGTAAGDGLTAGSSTSQFNFCHNLTGLFTFCAWVKFPSSVVTNNVLINTNNYTDMELGFNIRTQGNSNWRFLMGTSSTVVIDKTFTTNSIPTDNAFHFYCFRWDYTLGSNNLKFRRDDGNEELATVSGTASNSDHYNAMTVADYPSGTELDANILEFSIYNRILTAAEETALYNSGNGASIF
jgi:hypothetical protein